MSAALAVDPQVRDQLVMAHVDLVRSMASHLRRRLPPQVELSELISAGVLGLIDAASRYRPTLGVPFDAFARRRIQGAMLDALRELDRVPRSVRRLQREAENATASLRQHLGREPEATEIAVRVGISLEQYEQLLDDLRTAELTVARTVTTGGGRLIDLVFDGDEGQHVRLERLELRQRLAWAVTQLPERERQILALSYVEELTLSEIGRVFTVSESRVSQLRTQAVIRLRSLLRPFIASLTKESA